MDKTNYRESRLSEAQKVFEQSIDAKAAIYRIKQYLHQRSMSRSCNGDIHGFHVGDEEREAILTTSDIEAILAEMGTP